MYWAKFKNWIFRHELNINQGSLTTMGFCKITKSEMKLNSIPMVWLVELNIYTISVHSTFPLNTMRMNKSGRYLDIIRKQTKSNFNTIDWKAQCQDCIPRFVLPFSFKIKIKELCCWILTLQMPPGRYVIINAIVSVIVLIKDNGTLLSKWIVIALFEIRLVTNYQLSAFYHVRHILHLLLTLIGKSLLLTKKNKKNM